MTSYWCYRCTQFITIPSQTTLNCPHCQTGFIEAAEPTRNRNRSPFNPVIVLRNTPTPFSLYYEDGSGTGLQPVPAPMSEFLMGSGFNQLLEQLSQLEIARPENPPASKAAIENLPTVEINDSHVHSDSHCAICMDHFELKSEARELPCKHIYHHDCILPWLSLKNSCPVCRHELPSENSVNQENLLSPRGLTIWRLPGGGFAVGRFNGGAERELPAVYTEMDGGFNDARRVAFGPRRGRARDGRGFGRVLRNFASLFGRFRSGSSSSSSGSSGVTINRSQSYSGSVFGGLTRRRSRTWVLEDGNGISRW